jgi:hypothetical protein
VAWRRGLENGLAKQPDEVVPYKILPSVVNSVREVVGLRLKLFNGRQMVHQQTISIAVMNSAGKLIMESIIETKTITILQFIQGLRGDLHVTFEEGTWAAWLYDLLKPHVTKVVVCNPRKNALLKEGNKSDRIDARKLAELLRNGSLSGVYHGENGVRTLKELSRSYLTISKDLGRVMTCVTQIEIG